MVAKIPHSNPSKISPTRRTAESQYEDFGKIYVKSNKPSLEGAKKTMNRKQDITTNVHKMTC